MTLYAILTLLGDHIHVRIQEHLLTFFIICCAGIAYVAKAELR